MQSLSMPNIRAGSYYFSIVMVRCNRSVILLTQAQERPLATLQSAHDMNFIKVKKCLTRFLVYTVYSHACLPMRFFRARSMTGLNLTPLHCCHTIRQPRPCNLATAIDRFFEVWR
ncbi:MFS family permease [Pseudomonas syringae pv. actinidiae]|uniref:MFS family permease n=1 Tax=Pseudomonas syringae pv. actinidiae TaxID=103796 RepID=A0A2V0QIP7_PSESF|nr:MFS family permease [Pseudomonas syringae pv. actinidiae]